MPAVGTTTLPTVRQRTRQRVRSRPARLDSPARRGRVLPGPHSLALHGARRTALVCDTAVSADTCEVWREGRRHLFRGNSSGLARNSVRGHEHRHPAFPSRPAQVEAGDERWQHQQRVSRGRRGDGASVGLAVPSGWAWACVA